MLLLLYCVHSAAFLRTVYDYIVPTDSFSCCVLGRGVWTRQRQRMLAGHGPPQPFNGGAVLLPVTEARAAGGSAGIGRLHCPVSGSSLGLAAGYRGYWRNGCSKLLATRPYRNAGTSKPRSRAYSGDLKPAGQFTST